MNQISAQQIAPTDSLKQKTKVSENEIKSRTAEKPDSSSRVITLKGKVTDQSGERVPFTNVFLNQGKGEIFTNTDIDGNYSIQYEPQNWNQTDTMTFSFIGYKEHKIFFEANKSTLEINCVFKDDDELEFTAFYVKRPNIFRRTWWGIKDLFQRK
jgi:hypothetical protein